MTSIQSNLEIAINLYKNGEEKEASIVFKKVLDENKNEPIALEYFAVKEIKKRNFSYAIKLLSRAIKQPQCRPSALFQMGHALRDTGEIMKAEKVYSKYFSIIQSHDAAITYSDVLIRLLKYDKASDILNFAITKKPKDIKTLSMLAQTCENQGYNKRSSSIRANLIKIKESNKEDNYIKSAAFIDLGFFNEGFKNADKYLNSLYGNDLLDSINQYRKKLFSSLNGVLPKKNKQSPFLLVSCDLKYYKSHIDSLINSLKKKSSDLELHVHLILNEDASVNNIKNNILHHTLTWEIDKYANQTRFASRRYTIIPQLLKETNRSVIVIDIDSLINNNIIRAINNLPPFDVAMYHRQNEIFINQRIAAGISIFSHSENSYKIANAIAAYISYFEKKNDEKWFIDQMAMLAIKYFYSQKKELRIINLPEYFLDWQNYNKNSIIWTSKGDKKYFPGEPNS